MQEWLRNPWLLIFPVLILAMGLLGDFALASGLPISCYVLSLFARGTMVMAALVLLLPFLP